MTKREELKSTNKNAPGYIEYQCADWCPRWCNNQHPHSPPLHHTCYLISAKCVVSFSFSQSFFNDERLCWNNINNWLLTNHLFVYLFNYKPSLIIVVCWWKKKQKQNQRKIGFNYHALCKGYNKKSTEMKWRGLYYSSSEVGRKLLSRPDLAAFIIQWLAEKEVPTTEKPGKLLHRIGSKET